MATSRHLAAALLFATGLAAGASAEERPSYTPGRLVLKLTDDLARQARASISRSGGTDATTGNGVLDARIRRDGGRNLRAPFAARQTRAAARATRFPRRLPRAAGATASPALDRIFVLDLPPDLDMEQVAREYLEQPGVVWAEPERIYEAVFIPNDPYFSSSGSWGQPFRDLWGLVAISAPAAWDVTRGAGVIVAISDTGVDGAHPDIASRMWTNPDEIAGNGVDDDGNGYVDDVGGWDTSNGDNDPFDDNGHGTHVAGTVAAAGNNGLGITGVAFEARIMAVKGLGGGGAGATIALAESILYATDNGADVINASWGGFGTSEIINDAVATAHAAGVVFVAAAGNAARDMADFHPANHPGAIAVSAFDHNDQIADFSNFGPRIDVGAPGGGDVAPPTSNPSRSILSLRSSGSGFDSTVGGIYTRLAGTSMASPHVAGAAALVLSAHPTFTPEQVRQALRASADDVGAPGVDLESGYGRLNVAEAVLLTDVLAVHITGPAHDAVVSGLLTVTGTAAGPGFDSYVLEYGQGQLPTTWLPIGGSVTTPVESGVLGAWDLTVIPDGQYMLRARARTAGGTWFEDRVRVVLDHVVLASPALEDVFGAGGAPVEIRGTAAGFGFRDYRVEYRTIAPDLTVGPWTAAGISLPGGGSAAVLNGLLATLDPATLPGARDIDIRLTVTNIAGGASTKQTSHVVVDPTLRPGWPRRLGTVNSFPPRNLTLADLDGDGGQEILVVFQRQLYALRADASDLPGWPVSLASPASFLEAPPAVGDLDGDQQPEVVTRASFGIDIRRPDGTSMTTFVNGAYAGFGAPVLADLDRDGQLDILFGTSTGLYALRVDGSALPGFPVRISCRNEPPAPCFEGDIAVGDMDGDGSPEVAIIGNGKPGGLRPESGRQYLHIYSADGQLKLARAKKINGRRRIAGNAPIMADVDGDGRLDVTCNSDRRRLLAYNASGGRLRFMPRAPLPRYEYRIYSPTFRSQQEPVVAGDVNQDGFADMFLAMSFPDTPLVRGEPVTLFPPYVGRDHLVGLTSVASGLPYLWGQTFHYTQADKVYGPGTPAIGDIDGDGSQNVVIGSGSCDFWGFQADPDVRRCYTVHAFGEHGAVLPGFPKPTARYGIHKGFGPALGDLDGDGLTEIVWIDGTNQVSVWTVPGTPGPGRLQWPMFRGDAMHTGAFAGGP